VFGSVKGSRWSKPLSMLALLVLAAAGATAAYGVSAKTAATLQLDIEIAIDTTSSMGASIRQAQDDSKRLVNDVKARYPGALFAVVQFKDSGDTPEYQLLQPMTGDATKVDNAIDTLTPNGGGDYPESYNVVFQRSTDPATGWRAGSRKLVVVIGDAEPHGAGTDGYAGCTDRSTDPHGLSTKTVLAGMRAAQRTLIMVRQATTASTSLQCYQSLAAAGYAGGAARNGGEDVVSVIEALIGKAVTTPTKTTGTTPPPTSTTRNPNARIHFSFRTYANNVRVVPPLVGRFQLGTAINYGSGVLNPDGSVASGGVIRTVNRNTSPRITSSIWARVLSGRRSFGSGFVVLRLVVEVTGSNSPQNCVVGTRGSIVLVDDDRPIDNGQTGDSARAAYPRAGGFRRAPDGGASCRGYVQGWNNTDGGPRTSPARGGPGGGQWAVVAISKS
jgi:von Willebrand factor type A domain-containing protein